MNLLRRIVAIALIYSVAGQASGMWSCGNSFQRRMVVLAANPGSVPIAGTWTRSFDHREEILEVLYDLREFLIEMKKERDEDGNSWAQWLLPMGTAILAPGLVGTCKAILHDIFGIKIGDEYVFHEVTLAVALILASYPLGPKIADTIRVPREFVAEHRKTMTFINDAINAVHDGDDWDSENKLTFDIWHIYEEDQDILDRGTYELSMEKIAGKFRLMISKTK